MNNLLKRSSKQARERKNRAAKRKESTLPEEPFKAMRTEQVSMSRQVSDKMLVLDKILESNKMLVSDKMSILKQVTSNQVPEEIVSSPPSPQKIVPIQPLLPNFLTGSTVGVQIVPSTLPGYVFYSVDTPTGIKQYYVMPVDANPITGERRIQTLEEFTLSFQRENPMPRPRQPLWWYSPQSIEKSMTIDPIVYSKGKYYIEFECPIELIRRGVIVCKIFSHAGYNSLSTRRLLDESMISITPMDFWRYQHSNESFDDVYNGLSDEELLEVESARVSNVSGSTCIREYPVVTIKEKEPIRQFQAVFGAKFTSTSLHLQAQVILNTPVKRNEAPRVRMQIVHRDIEFVKHDYIVHDTILCETDSFEIFARKPKSLKKDEKQPRMKNRLTSPSPFVPENYVDLPQLPKQRSTIGFKKLPDERIHLSPTMESNDVDLNSTLDLNPTLDVNSTFDLNCDLNLNSPTFMEVYQTNTVQSTHQEQTTHQDRAPVIPDNLLGVSSFFDQGDDGNDAFGDWTTSYSAIKLKNAVKKDLLVVVDNIETVDDTESTKYDGSAKYDEATTDDAQYGYLNLDMWQGNNGIDGYCKERIINDQFTCEEWNCSTIFSELGN